MALGEGVSSIETTLKLAGVSLNECLRPHQQINMRSQDHRMDLKSAGQKSSPLDGGSCLAQGSAADLDSLNQGAGIFKGCRSVRQQDSLRQLGFSSKRKRVDSGSGTEHQVEYALGGAELEMCRSRDQMPPPPVPMQQPFVYRAGPESSDTHDLHPQHDHVNTAQFRQAPATPQRRPYYGVPSRLMHAPCSSIEPFHTPLARAPSNNGQSCVDRRQSAHAITGTAGPVYARGGWQSPPESFETERSGDYSSPSLSLSYTSQPPMRRSMGYHPGNSMFPIELGDCTIDPSSRSCQPISSDGSSSYRRSQSAFATEPQFESPAHSRNHDSSPNEEGRITFSQTRSFARRHPSDKGIGLSSHVRSSSRQTRYPVAKSSSHRQQLLIAPPANQHVVASARFSTRRSAYSSSLPSLSGQNSERSRRNDSFDCGPIADNSEMRPFSSANGEKFLLAQDPRTAQGLGRVPLAESQASNARRCARR